ncbi:glycosyltransferase [Nocardioides mangrovicus]|uniref:Glycosyltransferase n=1 Tax=Nocardioides mangrovicus TaxID=2478913 RepID=A0A3L8NYV5_9ACTN|nr:glycosyltransferase [Nocardioides mangrovicus]
MHTVSVVIPVYRGYDTLAGLVAEMEPLFDGAETAEGHRFEIHEVLLVHDCGPDRSPEVMRRLAEKYDRVRPVWLSRNFGQHAATLAGMASSGGDWIVTLDEDGQHDPAAIPRFLDVAMREQAALVYARPTNAAPHGALRNAASRSAKWVFEHLLRGGDLSRFQSYRLVLGEVGRSVAAYAGAGVFLDVAIGWVNDRTAVCDVELRAEGGRPSGYSTRSLLSHFWRMVLSSGTRGLRLVSMTGAMFAVLGVLLSAYVVVGRLTGGTQQPGWTSVMVVVLMASGLVLFSLGVVAEYVGVAVNMAMGRPPFLITADLAAGPLGRPPASRRS